MIVHCHSEMTEASSTHCLLRCFTRCFGIHRRHNVNGVKTTVETTQNGFSHFEEDEKVNGKATVVKVCEPNSNGINKPTQLKFVGEKTCCLSQRSADESPYGYEPIPLDKESNGCPVISKFDDPSAHNEDSIDTKSDKTLVKTNGHELVSSNGDAGCKRRHSHSSDLVEIKDIKITESPAPSGSSNKDSNILRGYNKIAEGGMEDHVADYIVSAVKHNCSNVSSAFEDSVAKPKDALKITENEKIVCNGDVPLPASASQIIPKVQGDEKNTEVLQNGQSEEGEHDIPYFKSLIEKETSNLNNLIQKWEKLLSEHSEINEEVGDEIRSVNGQTHLVISERFTQFQSLVEQSERQANGEQNDTKVITLTDLQGFWDMIFFQVQDVLAKFERLDKIRSNNWSPQLLHENNKKPAPKKNIKKPVNTRTKRTAKTANGQSSTSSEEEKARRIAARKRLAEARKRMTAQERTQSSTGGDNFIVQ